MGGRIPMMCNIEDNVSLNPQDIKFGSYEAVVIDEVMGTGAAKVKHGLSLKLKVDKHDIYIVILVETRTPDVNSNKILKSSKFDKVLVEEANGFSGGIWVMWNSKKAKEQSLSQTSQFIHICIEVGDLKKFLCTAVYASLQEETRHGMWEDVSLLSRSIIDLWILAGDFNDIKSSCKKKGNYNLNLAKCRRFQTFLDNCQGQKWNNHGRVYKKLDRNCANLRWKMEFEDVDARALLKILFDHNFFILSLSNKSQQWQDVGEEVRNVWNRLWAWKGPQKQKFFMWKILHNRLLTKLRLSQWGANDPTCPCYRLEDETIIHALGDCG
ncbi:uncharacterized protein LOC133315793 [Gastrolobium bilobum]|uniref:uncharacterized protein LOC133315793 n=1 Tax=Gastrolobium bilobum TaxID=150636 RepID=UPI002AB21A75|nr:uncharacterized protein LOC133315793 [Gastrolobium bilobum]